MKANISRDPQRKLRLVGSQSRNILEKIIEIILFICAIASVLTTVVFILIFASKTFDFFSVVSLQEFFGDIRWAPLSGRPSYGIWPLISGTLIVTAIAMIVALPLGLLSAVYLSEFAPGRVRKILKPVLEILAGIPTVVYGYFALLFITPILRDLGMWALENQIPILAALSELQFWNALSAGLVMGVMILPMVSSISEDAMHAVPQSLREGAYATGATRFEVAVRVILPAALSGIAAAFILAISRAIGETMIVAIAAGQTPNFPPDLLKPIMTLTAYIVNVATGDHEAGAQIWDSLFAVGTLLFLMTLVLNVISHYIVKRFRERYE
jgi:phosphate transport system permease protein